MAAIISPDPTLLKGLYLVLLVVALDVLLGLVISLKNRNFDLRRLPSFLATEILPYVVALAALSTFSMLDESGALKALTVASMGAYTARMLAQLKDKVFELFGVGKE